MGNRMLKRFFCVVLCVLMLVPGSVTVFGEENLIADTDDFELHVGGCVVLQRGSFFQ